MAISLTDLELSTLDSAITPLDPNDDWVITDGGSSIRCDVERMNEELVHIPQDDREVQSLESLRAYQADSIAARSK